MSRLVRHRTAWAAALGLTVLTAQAGAVGAQNASAPVLKAAFLFNFVKFAQWPGGAVAPGVPLVLCVLGDDQVADALRDVTGGRQVDGRAMVVRRVGFDDVGRACHLLYIAGADAKQLLLLIQKVGLAPVLTVSELSAFARAGGIVSLIVEDERMRFEINVEAANRARLRLSSRLLSLATIVKDQPDAAVR